MDPKCGPELETLVQGVHPHSLSFICETAEHGKQNLADGEAAVVFHLDA